MAIYGLYSGNDGLSHLTVLQMAKGGPPINQVLDCLGWRPFQCEPGHTQSRHPTPVIGMTILLGGCMEIGVGGGTLKHVSLRPGDALLVADTQGEGHSTKIVGPDALQVVGFSLNTSSWSDFRQYFSGWPDNALNP